MLLDPVTSVSGAATTQAAPFGSRRSRIVRVNDHLLPQPGTRARAQEDDIELELFPNVTVRAVFDRFETIAGVGTWRGHVDGMPASSVALAYRDRHVNANISTPDGVFVIQPAPGTVDRDGDSWPLHLVSEIAPESLSEGRDTIEVPLDPLLTDESPAARAADNGDTIDLMVVYTPAAQARAGGQAGIANLIALGLSDTNTANAGSGIRHRFRLVHTALVPYVESVSTPLASSLTDLQRGASGFAGVPNLRNIYSADLVMVLVAPPAAPDACGIAYLGPNERFGFSSVDVACVPNYTFAHELGHNLGARHDWFVDEARAPFAFGKGHVDLTRRWRTIMAYDDACRASGFSCRRLNLFSTPDVEVVPFCTGSTAFNCDLVRYWFYPVLRPGVPLSQSTACRVGVRPSTPCAADNRLVINTVSATVANYRASR